MKITIVTHNDKSGNIWVNAYEGELSKEQKLAVATSAIGNIDDEVGFVVCDLEATFLGSPSTSNPNIYSLINWTRDGFISGKNVLGEKTPEGIAREMGD